MPLTRVNTTSGADYTGSSSTTIAAAAASHTTGNMLIVGVRWGVANAFSTIADTAGNTYRKIGRSGFSASAIELFVANNITGHATNVVTATVAPSNAFRGIVVAQYSGQAIASPVLDAMPSIDGFTSASSGTSKTSLPFTTLIADELIVALSQVNSVGGTWTPDTGFSTAVQDASNVLYLQDRIVSSIQTGITVTCTSSQNAGVDLLVATFTAPLTGGGGSPGGSPGDGGTETGFATVGG